MYEIYITDALVCGSRNSNTSDRSYLLLTREAGMVWASVKSVREEHSKHRYALQDFSRSRVSLVRGRGGWRVTGAEPIGNVYFELKTRTSRTVVRDALRLLRRFLQGETPAPKLYDDLVLALTAPEKDMEQIAPVLTLRVLHALGYVAPAELCRPLIEASDTRTACKLLTAERKAESVKAIEQALEVSHL